MSKRRWRGPNGADRHQLHGEWRQILVEALCRPGGKCYTSYNLKTRLYPAPNRRRSALLEDLWTPSSRPEGLAQPTASARAEEVREGDGAAHADVLRQVREGLRRGWGVACRAT